MNKILPKNIIIKSLTLMINKSLKYKEERHNTYIDIPENIDSRLKKKTQCKPDGSGATYLNAKKIS